MTAELELEKLLTAMSPELREGEYVFSSVTQEDFDDMQIEPVGWFREVEGISLILDRAAAQRLGLKQSSAYRMISLNVNSSLEAVGFLAAVTEKLAAAGVSVNAVSAFHHDHLFIPAEKANLAMSLLNDLAADAA
ncbi:MAG: ACT domain-containing protein [Chloroflexi bacterium]|nr:ACT domain-containing protein [Chloroflexota bacterium]MCI0828449.1 ACT domain-containing protein [Chloroflexota bacterium]MCI0854933.1 ACT domain-containing protein [Chloroflexota bacterium]MCI0877188.1 ACT domain-containing protein [Chloroflexota bacterium]